MRPSILRSSLRYFHILTGALISAFIYSPYLRDNAMFETVLQFAILPLLILSGVLMWQMRWLKPLMR